MKIAIDVSPLNVESKHKVRGVGFYIQNLVDSLEKYAKEHTYLLFSEKIPKDADIVHFPYFEPFFLSLPLHLQKKTVVTVHDLTPLVFPNDFPVGIKGRIKWQIQKQSLINKQAIITDSNSSQKDIAQITSISLDKIHIVYLAASDSFTDKNYSDSKKKEIQKKLGLPERFVLYVGDVTPNKNLPRLLEAVQIANVPIVMVGKTLQNWNYDKTNPWNKDLVSVHEKIQTMSNVYLKGFVSDEDLVNIYNTATVSIMPSIYEGFGLPVLEAMRCGCPVIASDGGSLKEVAGEAAYIIDPYSIDSIRAGIEEVFRDKKLRQELSAKGKKQEQKFSWEKTAKHTASVYASLVGTS